MHICEIKTVDIANGPGMRVSLFVSGCTNHCKGCFQPETWDFNYGKEWTNVYEEMIMTELAKSFYKGITFLGGDPFEFVNQRELVKLLRRIKKELPDKDVWAYTGFVYDRDFVPNGNRYCEVTDEMLSMIDILVDGPFVEEKKNVSLRFRGSENQRIIDLNETRRTGNITIWAEGNNY